MLRCLFIFLLIFTACKSSDHKTSNVLNKAVPKKTEKKGIVSINIFTDSTSKEYNTLSCHCNRKHSSLPDTIQYPMSRLGNLFIDIKNNTSKDIMITTRNGCYLGLGSGLRYYDNKEKDWIISIADGGGGDNQNIPSNSTIRLLVSRYDTDSLRYSFNMEVDTLNDCKFFNVAFSAYKNPQACSFHSDIKIEEGHY